MQNHTTHRNQLPIIRRRGPVGKGVADNQALEPGDLRDALLSPPGEASVGREGNYFPCACAGQQSHRVVQSATGVHHIIHDYTQRAFINKKRDRT